ncbi:MAG TPA: hypothetical protein VF719_08650, partial [Abditibacteriaceae bacterium]
RYSYGLSGVFGTVTRAERSVSRAWPNLPVNLRSADGKRQIARTRTDHNGNFLFQVPTGRYLVAVSKDASVKYASADAHPSDGVLVRAHDFAHFTLTLNTGW